MARLITPDGESIITNVSSVDDVRRILGVKDVELIRFKKYNHHPVTMEVEEYEFFCFVEEGAKGPPNDTARRVVYSDLGSTFIYGKCIITSQKDMEN